MPIQEDEKRVPWQLTLRTASVPVLLLAIFQMSMGDKIQAFVLPLLFVVAILFISALVVAVFKRSLYAIAVSIGAAIPLAYGCVIMMWPYWRN